MTAGGSTRARSGAPSSSIARARAAGREALREALPGPHLSWRLARRSLGVWIALRLAVHALATLPAGVIDPMPAAPNPASTLVFAAVVGALAIVDVHRRNERLLLANLGVRRRTVVLIGAISAAAGESILGILLGALG